MRPSACATSSSRRRIAAKPSRWASNTDAYQPIEREQRITRGLLEVLHETDHPVALITKSSLIERDIDLLAPMAAKRLAEVGL